MEKDEIIGRKIIRENRQQKSKQARNRKIVMLVMYVLIFLVGMGVGKSIAESTYEPVKMAVNDLKVYGTEAKPIIFNNYDLEIAEYTPLDVPLDYELQEYIFNLSTSYGIDFNLVMALIKTESSFQTNVKSKTNDYGLMQINECNHDWLSEKLGIKNFNNPYDNVRAGLYILRGLFDRYGDDTHKVLMAYNMGESGARKLWDKGVTETNYSIKIINQANKYRKEVDNGR